MIEAEIEKIGVLRNPVISWQEGARRAGAAARPLVDRLRAVPFAAVREPRARKVMIIGLDCAEPSLLDAWRAELPVLSGLIDRGVHGRLTSIIPPITVPAWSCMMASRTPGDLGVYGFRNRSDHSYGGAFIADSTAIRDPRLWEIVGRAGGPFDRPRRARHLSAEARCAA